MVIGAQIFLTGLVTFLAPFAFAALCVWSGADREKIPDWVSALMGASMITGILLAFFGALMWIWQ